jgi:hypothetical protein
MGISTVTRTFAVAGAAALALALSAPAAWASPAAATGVAQGGTPQTKPVQMSASKTYTHPAGVFRIDLPGNWTMADESGDGVVAVSFTDPTKNAALIVRVKLASEVMDEDALAVYVDAAVSDRFRDAKKLVKTKPKAFDDGSVGIGFTYNAAVGKQTVPMRGEAYAQMDGQRLASLLIAVLPAEQYDKLAKSIGAILNSYQADPDSVTAAGVVIGDLRLYKHPKGIFQIKAPAAWSMADHSKTGTVLISFLEPLERSLIAVEVINVKQPGDAETLIHMAELYVQKLYGDEPGFKAQDAKFNKEGTASQFFMYDSLISGEDAKMGGACFVDQKGTAVAFFRVLIPAASSEAVSDKLDEIATSLKLTKNAKVP